MPQNLQAFIWILGVALIAVLLGIVGFLLKDKLGSILEQVKGLRDDLKRLFEREEQNAKDIVDLKGEIRTIKETCKLKCPIEG
jgi:Tfp pilus assembly protein PilO